MPLRSQRHMREVQGRDSGGMGGSGIRVKPLTGILPDTPSAPRLGPYPRNVFPLTSIGGLGPFTWSLLNNVGLMLIVPIGSNLVTASWDPIGPPGEYDLLVNVVDVRGSTLTETVRLTLW
jgi:hypothetical protein